MEDRVDDVAKMCRITFCWRRESWIFHPSPVQGRGCYSWVNLLHQRVFWVALCKVDASCWYVWFSASHELQLPCRGCALPPHAHPTPLRIVKTFSLPQLAVILIATLSRRATLRRSGLDMWMLDVIWVGFWWSFLVVLFHVICNAVPIRQSLALCWTRHSTELGTEVTSQQDRTWSTDHITTELGAQITSQQDETWSTDHFTAR